MPQRTIAAGGGNWNSTGTWVEGAVPTSSDFVVGNASSGQLTINVAAACQYVDFTSYANTLTMNNTITASLASSTNTFGTSMSFAGTSSFNINSTSTIVQNTTNRIPALNYNSSGTFTLSTDVNVVNLLTGTNGFTITAGVARNLNVSGSFTSASAGISLNANITVNFDGTGTINARFLGGSGTQGLWRINTAGTLTFDTTNGIYFIDTANFTYVAGTLVTPTIRWIAQTTGTLTLNSSGVNWDNFIFTDIANAATQSIALAQDLNVGTFIIARDRGSSTETIQFTSTGKLNVTDRMILQTNTSTLSGIFRLNTTGAHYIDKLFALSGSFAKYLFRSTTNGVKATLQLGDKSNSPIFYVDFTDINASSGQEIRTYNGTVSNCDNVVSYSSTIFAAGGGETSSVFIS